MQETIKHIAHNYYVPIIIILCIASCSNSNYNPVPSLPVQFVYNVLADDPTFVPANTGAYKIIKERRYETDYIGFGGLLLYIGMDMQHHAFDLACPKCLSVQNTVEVDGMFAICPICNEHYDLSYGYGVPTRGISGQGLRTYRCYWDGTKLTISN